MGGAVWFCCTGLAGGGKRSKRALEVVTCQAVAPDAENAGEVSVHDQPLPDAKRGDGDFPRDHGKDNRRPVKDRGGSEACPSSPSSAIAMPQAFAVGASSR